MQKPKALSAYPDKVLQPNYSRASRLGCQSGRSSQSPAKLSTA